MIFVDRKAVLLHHPDKQAQDNVEIDDETFKKVQHGTILFLRLGVNF